MLIALGLLLGVACIALMVGFSRRIRAERHTQRLAYDVTAINLAQKTADQSFFSLRHYEGAIAQVQHLRRGAYQERTKAEIGNILQTLEANYATAKAAGNLPDALHGIEKLF